MAAQKHIELDVDVAAGTPETIVTAGQRPQQVITHLLSNALKLTERGRCR